MWRRRSCLGSLPGNLRTQLALVNIISLALSGLVCCASSRLSLQESELAKVRRTLRLGKLQLRSRSSSFRVSFLFRYFKHVQSLPEMRLRKKGGGGGTYGLHPVTAYSRRISSRQRKEKRLAKVDLEPSLLSLKHNSKFIVWSSFLRPSSARSKPCRARDLVRRQAEHRRPLLQNPADGLLSSPPQCRLKYMWRSLSTSRRSWALRGPVSSRSSAARLPSTRRISSSTCSDRSAWSAFRGSCRFSRTRCVRLEQGGSTDG